MKLSFAVAVAGILTTQAAISAPVTYICNIDNQETRGWIAPQYVFNIEPNSKHASHTTSSGGFTSSKLRVDRKGNYRISWQEKPKAANGQKFWIDYFAQIDIKQNTISLRGTFVQRWLVNPPKTIGNCTVTTK